MLFGQIASAPSRDLLRRITFEDGTINVKDWGFPRRVGRPCLRWREATFAMALSVANYDQETLSAMVSEPDTWKAAVRRHLNI